MSMVGASPLSWAGCAIAASQQRAARSRGKVLAVLRESQVSLSIAAIADQSGLSYFSARRALETLTAMRAVECSGPKNNQRFAITGRGLSAGGPASESAAGASAGDAFPQPRDRGAA